MYLQNASNPWRKHTPPLAVAFYCDHCHDAVFEHELEDTDCYATPTGQIICVVCVDSMTAVQALAYMGCTKMGYITRQGAWK